MDQPIILIALPREMQALRQSGEGSPAMEHIWIGIGMVSDANNFLASQKETQGRIDHYSIDGVYRSDHCLADIWLDDR